MISKSAKLLADAGTPPIKQLGGDWFGGTEDAFTTDFPNLKFSGSLWHLLRNIQRNQRTRGARKFKNRPNGYWAAINYVIAFGLSATWPGLWVSSRNINSQAYK